MIYAQNEMLLGEFTYENIYGIIYNPNKTLSFEQSLESGLGLDSFKDHEEIISHKAVKIVKFYQ